MARTPVVRRLALAAKLLVVAAFVSFLAVSLYDPSPSQPPGMVFVPGGEFVMGNAADDAPENETPVHRVRLDGFWMDETEVTNAQFRAFVAGTGYVTVAERVPDWEQMRKSLPPDTPKPPADKLVPGSLVFEPPAAEVPLTEFTAWWRYVPGADWKHPEGPTRGIDGKDEHPVVHVGWEDAVAYAEWAGKRLPTEAEWEYAARGGLAGKRFAWGNDAPTEADGRKANIWQGRFPVANTRADGFDRTAPVKTYPANGYGLYDTAGNVWEWCNDWYRADVYAQRHGVAANPKGPADAWDPREPHTPSRVIRGGSFLCHVTYCESYRPAARRGSAVDNASCHIGFRCAKDGPPPK